MDRYHDHDVHRVRSPRETGAIVLLGPPGSGKGTQTVKLKEMLGVPAISTGEILRAECASDTRAGRALKELLAGGNLAKDETVNGLVSRHLKKQEFHRGFVLDGYPRTLDQADFLRDLLPELHLPQPTVLHFVASRETLVRRIAGRRQCASCGRLYNVHFNPPRNPGFCDQDGNPLTQRADDRERVVRERLAIYERTTRPVVDYYRSGDFHDIDADAKEPAVCAAIQGALARVAVGVLS